FVQCLTMDRNMRSVRVKSDGHGVTSHEISGVELLIGISDTGPGIPAELREKVFYPFFTTKQHGSGIGLAAAQKVAVSHGGIIEISGEEGEGATFLVRLPLAESDVEARLLRRPQHFTSWDAARGGA
ncbi:unnamed protein product, partial [marine sediment metagenome]